MLQQAPVRFPADTEPPSHLRFADSLPKQFANRSVAVPIYGDMAKFISLQPRDSEYVFARGSTPIRCFRASWDRACTAAGVPDLLFHDLRRERDPLKQPRRRRKTILAWLWLQRTQT